MENITIDYYLSGYEDEDRERLRDFMNLMNWGYNHQLELNPNPIKDELEYKKRVYEYYILSVIKNHILISLLIDDREGRLEKPISEMSVKEFNKKINDESVWMYNSYVLGKDIPQWDDELNINNKF
tara:strand:+ start:317 stop:694 length:378 start_codon:yes stop_codon:yes gene_type:complete